MRALSLPVLLSLPLAAFVYAPAASAGVVLDVGFEDMVTGGPLPAGGAVARAPGELQAGAITTAIERHDNSNWLAIGDNDDYAAGAVRFEPPGSPEFRRGEVAISADLYFDPIEEGAGFNVYVRERSTSASSFLNLHFSDQGSLSITDASGPTARHVTGYGHLTGRPLPLDLVFDMDEGTYDVWLDGELIVDNARHGVSERGIGAVLFGTEHDADNVGVFYVDNILMSHERPDLELW